MVDRPFGSEAHPWYLAIASGGRGTTGSRVGGNPPACFHAQPDLAPYLATHRYLLTLSDDFRELTGGYDLSVWLPAGFRVFGPDTIYPRIAVACLLHPPAPPAASDAGRLDAVGEGRLLRQDRDADPDAAYFTKIGGRPDLIQDEPHYQQALHADGYSFLLQIDEFGYPDDFVTGDHPLGFGGLYVYGKFAANGVVCEVTAGYTQFS